MLSKKHKLLILDEPFTALDVNTQEKLISLSKKYVLSKEKAIKTTAITTR